ncbi:MAG: hypothetical protein KJ674_04510 [Nanoarchaeota archaeon]|nr:hypothetical protein [Nanoarchaeota archaeon]
MTDEWYLRFESENERILDLIKALKKENLLDFIELIDKYGKIRRKIKFEELPPLKKINNIKLGNCISSFVYGPGVKKEEFSKEPEYINPNTRSTTLYIIGASKGLDKKFLKILKIMGNTLNPSKFKAIDVMSGPDPFYKGNWNFEFFKEKILPKIEYEKGGDKSE